MEWDSLIRAYLGFALPLATGIFGLFLLRRSRENEVRRKGYGSALLMTVMAFLLFLAHINHDMGVPVPQLQAFGFLLMIFLPLAMPIATMLVIAKAPQDDVFREAFGVVIVLGWAIGLYLIYS